LLRRIFELDPFLCPKCELTMKIVSVLTELEFRLSLQSWDRTKNNCSVFGWRIGRRAEVFARITPVVLILRSNRRRFSPSTGAEPAIL